MELSELQLSELLSIDELKDRIRQTEKTAAWLRTILRATDLKTEMDFLPDDRPNLFQQLHNVIANEKWPQGIFPIGSSFPDVWTVSKDFVIYAPLRLVAYEKKVCADGIERLGAVLLRERVSYHTMVFDNIERRGAPHKRDIYGYNRYLQSALHQWLNSDKPGLEWWHPQHEYDCDPGHLYQLRGYLAGCSPELLEAIGEFQLVMPAVDDEGVTFRDQGYCKFFIPSLEELGIDPTNKLLDDPPGTWAFFQDSQRHRTRMDESRRHVFYDNYGKPRLCHLRSADLETSTDIWGLNPDGSLTRNPCLIDLTFTPACMIF